MKNSLRVFLPRVEIAKELPDGSVEVESLGGLEVELEHSLVTVFDWEGYYRRPFLSKEFGYEDIKTYLPFMCQTPNVPDKYFSTMSYAQEMGVLEYILDNPTASKLTTKNLPKPKKTARQDPMTAETIYYLIAQFGLPIQVERWHFNRLMQLITVCSIKNSPPKKMGKKEAMELQRKLNEERRASLGTSG